jgi:hypothetical protein
VLSTGVHAPTEPACILCGGNRSVDRVHGCENMHKIPGGRFVERQE